MASTDTILQGVNILGAINDEHKKILTPAALAFLALLHRSFNNTRKQLLERRKIRQAELDKGNLPDFLPETKHIRDNETWKGAPPAPGLVDRRVEITGPTDRKMVVNALNSDVWTYMADFEGEFGSCQGWMLGMLGHMEISRLGLTKDEGRLKRSHMGQHDQWPGESLRRQQAPGRLQAGPKGVQAPNRPHFAHTHRAAPRVAP